jgi:sensor histidine kinase YesM
MTKNSIAKSIHTGGGIGLKNLRRRLELIYQPGTYSFFIDQNETFFSVTILIPKVP